MRLTHNFAKSTKTLPNDEPSKNAQLLIKAGFIHKEMAGVYALLPLGIRVMDKIKQIVRDEMNSVGGQEIIMTNLQRQELWQTTDRWDDKKVDIWFKTSLKNGTPVGLAWSHEEPITDMMKNYVSSYRDLPVLVYQFQTKLRNELRAKSGLMRGREFVMKDLYSYSPSQEAHDQIYDRLTEAYLKVFQRVGLGDYTFVTYASGGAFTQFSHEFQTITEAGEDTIYLDRTKKLAVNKEVYTPTVLKQLGLGETNLEELKASEVGNIFSFGTAKSEQLGLYFTDKSGQEKPVVLGSYGIGITRLIGVIAEHFTDNKGLVWPDSVAPAQVYLINLGASPDVKKQADSLYQRLTDAGVEVIYDDRDVSPGQKLASGDLIGLPERVVISDKTIAKQLVEWKSRRGDAPELISQTQLDKSLGL